MATTLKTACLHPQTGTVLQIDASIYTAFSEAICRRLEKGPGTYTELVAAIKAHLQKQGTAFERSVGWYAVAVKNDLEARGLIRTAQEKGRKIHYLAAGGA